MPYSFFTLGQAKQALIQRLYVATGQFFADPECGIYIQEAQQAFNSLANFYRAEFIINLSQNVTWYDLTTASGTLRPLTTTDTSLVEQIEYHFLEPQTSSYPLVWTGSRQFAITDLLNAIQQVRDQLLSESGCTITQSLIAATPGRTFLQDTAIQLRRVCWIPVAGFGFAPNCLLPSDIWGQQSFEAGFPQATPGYPLTYRRSSEPPLSFDVDIQPAVPGQYDILTVNAGATLSTAAAATLPIPDDWTWVNKWGSVGQLLNRESSATDALRSKYGIMRYKQGVAAMQMAPALIAARINDVPVTVEAITAADFYAANWQGATAGPPTAVYYAGLNQVAAAPAPDSGGPYSITASVVQNMPLPANDAAYLQVGRDDVQAILDYAQHVAMFKCGGEEFAKTLPLFQNFMKHCSLYNSKLAALSPFLEMIDLRSQEDERQNPMFSKVNPATVK